MVDDFELPVVAQADDPPIGILKNPRLVSKVNQIVADRVGNAVRAGKLAGQFGLVAGSLGIETDAALAVTLGGDHSLAMGTVSGTLSAVSISACPCPPKTHRAFQYPNACLIWIDAHAVSDREHSNASADLIVMMSRSIGHQHARNDPFGQPPRLSCLVPAVLPPRRRPYSRVLLDQTLA